MLPFFPIAILSGLIAPNLLLVEGSLAVGTNNPHLIAGAAGLVAAWVTENMLATVSVGMGVLWVLLSLS
ncbi:MAG: AzlD domain-containing protein [archaeon]